MKSTLKELKNILNLINSMLEEAVKKISALENGVMESNQAEQVREKNYIK